MIRKINPALWTGRTDHVENRSSFRYHQVIEIMDIDEIAPAPEACAIIGFECEEGVQRNKGRLGAAQAPNALRGEISKLPWKFPANKRIIDIGNIACLGNELEEAQQQLGFAVEKLLSKKTVPIIFGGGHETAYGHYLGVRNYIGKDASLGIINIDAHFDLRSYEEQISSGTMFKQILDHDPNSRYFVAGIQRFGNTQELFDRADELGVLYEYEENIHHGNFVNLQTALTAFIEDHDYVLLTLCSDVLNAAFAPGVSAPSPFGLEPSLVRSIIQLVAAHPKTVSFDISEVNPMLDENNRTVKLGAYLANEAIAAFLGRYRT
ncbi:formimidoylglutamase [Sporosarcina sp. HYO08]|uniref:formimidoylglutamase n=1 Tax=Sporosarcina sp. HYO08 TaxID=1759557 RepID=UPI00079C7696|nr:formimidoylglutamase [Sporosarcina sp. HYO08]KXH83866.1 formimidoylglutamase [Sporosarcina sp. HYO08]